MNRTLSTISSELAGSAMLDALTEDNPSPPPSAFVHYFAAVDAYASGNIEVTRAAISRFISSSTSKANDESTDNRKIRLGYRFPGIGDAVLRALASVPAYARTASTPITVVKLRASEKASLNAALHLLNQLWPEASDEVESSVAVINGFSSDRVIGFTDIHSHGAVFLRTDDIARSPSNLSEEILHEASHIRFNALLAGTPLFVDTGHVFQSPLRPDPRPVFGVIHQVFVLARVVVFLSRAVKEGMRDVSDLDVSRRKLGSGLAQLRDHANLTADGDSLLTSIETDPRVGL
jgi:HEXXH motif-containing protein